MDLVTTVNKLPRPGETITGNSFHNFPGGKGANQAVAAGKLGGNVAMFGKLGNDNIATQYLDVFREFSINTKGITIERETHSGIAVIEVDAGGENRIIVVPGANGLIDRNFIDAKYDELLTSDIILLQLEIPIDSVEYLLQKLHGKNKIIILDPAPATELNGDFYKDLDFITPNETEMELLTGCSINSKEDLLFGANKLLNKGVKNVIAKVGAKGAFLINHQGIEEIKGFQVKAIDTTAAGDTFNGAFAYSLSKNNPVKESVRFACAAAALSTTGLGAQGAMPTLVQVEELMNQN